MRILTATLAGLVLLLAGCAAAPVATDPPQPAATASTPQGDPATEQFLARYGLDGLTPQQIVETLDAATTDRDQGPVGSVRPSEVVLSDGEQEVALPLPDDVFYLAFAPYRDRTHDCFNHNLATCSGELSGEVVKVTVVDDAGATLVDTEVTTHANGFAGVWLPRDIAATLTVSHAGESVTAPIATGANDPTCLTTLKLG